MANASSRDTRAGFDVYRAAGGDISRDELNRRLFDAGYGPVAERTVTHYRKLLAAGYDRYISINRFDIARASAPYEDASANPRYRFTETDTGVTLVLAKGSKLYEASGRATELGETGAIVRFLDDEYAIGLAKLKPQPGDMVSLRFLEVGRTSTGRIIESDLKSRPALVEVEYSALESLADMHLGSPLPNVRHGFRVAGAADEALTTDVVGRRVYQFFEVVEEARSVVNLVGSSVDAATPSYAPPVLLERLSVASPAEFVLSMSELVKQLLPVGLIGAVITAAATFVDKRKTWHEGSGVQLDNQVKRIDLELKQLAVEQKRAEVELAQAASTLLQQKFPTEQIGAAAIEKAVKQGVIPALRRLGESGVISIDELDEG